jgi:hypothetical protein
MLGVCGSDKAQASMAANQAAQDRCSSAAIAGCRDRRSDAVQQDTAIGIEIA